jgi:EAL domain-containing protein (putative c-di-GMP-specific phosphodiesterase class I)
MMILKKNLHNLDNYLKMKITIIKINKKFQKNFTVRKINNPSKMNFLKFLMNTSKKLINQCNKIRIKISK